MTPRVRSAKKLLKATLRMATLVYVGAAETACNLQVTPCKTPDTCAGSGGTGGDAGHGGASQGGAPGTGGTGGSGGG